MSNLTILCFLLVALAFVSGYDRTITSARVESCRGCSLNRLPEVKKFIFTDIPQYDKVEFKAIHGAKPELVLLSDAGEEIHRLPLSTLTRLECNELLETHGFNKLPQEDIQDDDDDSAPRVKSEF